MTAAGLHNTEGCTVMDRISDTLLRDFSTEHGITDLPEDKRFEHFSCYATIRQHYRPTFDTADVVTGSGNDTHIDGVAIIVNNQLITDVDEFEEIAKNDSSIDASFIFVQARRAPKFDCAELGDFGFGVKDFFNSAPVLKRNASIVAAAEVMSAIYSRSAQFKIHGQNSNPSCRMYYVTTGTWAGDHDLEARRTAAINDLEATHMFSSVDCTPIDVEKLHMLYLRTKRALSCTFEFPKQIVLPDAPGVKQAYLGILPATEFLKLLTDDSGDLLSGLFYDNVREWKGYNEVNNQIKGTLESEDKLRFALMNNGITVIARSLMRTADKYTIENYSIVNGCQTSNVLFDQHKAGALDDSVMVPVRIIETLDESIIKAIIHSTNYQTEVKEEQFYALLTFAKKLESFFQTFPEPYQLYFERQDSQYDRMAVGKKRVITKANLIRAFASMFMDEPHRATRSFGSLKAKVGKEIFVDGQRSEPYYAAAFALYRLEGLFGKGILERKFKPARYHILMAARVLWDSKPLPPMNSYKMEDYCKELTAHLQDDAKSSELLKMAAAIVGDVAQNDFNRDNIRTEPFTKKVLAACKSAVDAGRRVQ
jgi:hypothetical protein